MGFSEERVEPNSASETAERAASSSASPAAHAASSTRYRPSASVSALPRPQDSSRGTSTGQQSTPAFDYEAFHFLASAIIIAMAVVSVFPFASGALALRCYYVCLMGYFLLAASDINHKYGIPKGFSLSALKEWFREAGAGPEVLAILNAGAFLPQPLIITVIPPACHLAIPVAEFLQQRFSRAWIYRVFLKDPCSWITVNRNVVKLYAAHMEIFLGLLLLVLMFTPQRSLVTLLFYWQVLRAEYHSPVTSRFHRHVWGGFEEQAVPVLQQHVPYLATAVGYAKEWFQD